MFLNNFGFNKSRISATLSLFLLATLFGCVTGQKETKPTAGAAGLMSLGVDYDHRGEIQKVRGVLMGGQWGPQQPL